MHSEQCIVEAGLNAHLDGDMYLYERTTPQTEIGNKEEPMPSAVTHDTNTSDDEKKALFTSLYTEKFRLGVRKRLTFLLRAENHIEIDDLEQVVWMNVWRNLPLDRPVGFCWLATIATNATNDFLRKKYLLSSGGRYEKEKPPVFSLDADWGTYSEINAAQRDLVERAEDKELIRQVFTSLPKKYRDICVLFVQGWQYTAIMARLGVSKRAVWNAVRCMQLAARKAREQVITG